MANVQHITLKHDFAIAFRFELAFVRVVAPLIAEISVHEIVAGLKNTLKSEGLSQGNQFIDYNCAVIPW